MMVVADSNKMELPEQNSPSARVELTESQRQVIAELRSATRAEVIACAFCDTDSPPNLESAMLSGWKRLQIDDGVSWNYMLRAESQKVPPTY